jgi:hypothetical protein
MTTNWNITTNGMIIDSTSGERPVKTPKELIVSRAVEAKDGWLGQIIMSGEIVYETEPQVGDEDETGAEKALALVNQHILDAFKRLIVGA